MRDFYRTIIGPTYQLCKILFYTLSFTVALQAVSPQVVKTNWKKEAESVNELDGESEVEFVSELNEEGTTMLSKVIESNQMQSIVC